MTRIMLGPLLWFMASVSPASAAPPRVERVSGFKPIGGATASATVSIRVISGARFGPDYLNDEVGATRRRAQLTDADGLPRPAEILEFQ